MGLDSGRCGITTAGAQGARGRRTAVGPAAPARRPVTGQVSGWLRIQEVSMIGAT